ncbi:MAG: radical SAM protein [Planctomycetota bacterium]|jgi:wyosine [tRNA(Phe)-imidazoG37] synthetase (radical SAM superfamily)
MAEKEKYLYGPVASRRLGLSLGVDIVPFKICTLDCVYCQLGKTSKKTTERGDYCDVAVVLSELRSKLEQGLEADYITISGSGEPTLNSRLGELIDSIKQITDIPVAVLTNGTLLYRKDVRADCARADVVLPSLDTADEETFQKINRPHTDISIKNLIAGTCAFRDEFAGQIWLEVFLLEGLNTDTQQIGKINDAIERIRPDKVQLNTAVRPTAEAGLRRLSAEKLQAIAARLGRGAEVVADFSPRYPAKNIEQTAENVLSMLKRRPCSLKDICTALSIHHNEAQKYIARLQQQGVVYASEKEGITFFKAK